MKPSDLREIGIHARREVDPIYDLDEIYKSIVAMYRSGNRYAVFLKAAIKEAPQVIKTLREEGWEVVESEYYLTVKF